MKATHYGTCQICSSLQKAPSGYIAKHGYDIKYGFFNGVCRGSNELPYEVSNELLVTILAKIKVRIENYVEEPAPKRVTPSKFTCGYLTAKREASAAWIAEERAEAAWKAKGEQYWANVRFVPFAEARIAAWVPAALIPVQTVEAREQVAKGSRKDKQALSRAADLAKRELVKFGERFEHDLDQEINGALYIERQAFWDACAAKGEVLAWPNWEKLVRVSFQSNRVAKFVSLAKQTGNADLIEGAAKLEELGAAYEAARAAYEAAKA
jgi:hypothetical protein